MLADEGFKLPPRELLEKLTKNAAYSIQGEVSFWLVVSFFGRTPLNLTETSPFRQNLNLDKCAHECLFHSLNKGICPPEVYLSVAIKLENPKSPIRPVAPSR
jgi:hypothetical protein